MCFASVISAKIRRKRRGELFICLYRIPARLLCPLTLSMGNMRFGHINEIPINIHSKCLAENKTTAEIQKESLIKSLPTSATVFRLFLCLEKHVSSGDFTDRLHKVMSFAVKKSCSLWRLHPWKYREIKPQKKARVKHGIKLGINRAHSSKFQKRW